MKILISSLLAIFTLTVHSITLAAGAYSGGGPGSNSWQYENVSDAAYSTYNKAKKNLRKQRFEKALTQLLKAESIDPESADIQNLLGYTYRHLEKLEQSYQHYDKALSLDPEHVGATEYLGQLYVALGESDKAEIQLKKLKMYCGIRCAEYQALSQSIAAGTDLSTAALN